jgi:hypothetical protein
MDIAEKHKLDLLRARAAIFLALEEQRSDSGHVLEAIGRAIDLTKPIDLPDFKLLLGRLLRQKSA